MKKYYNFLGSVPQTSVEVKYSDQALELAFSECRKAFLIQQIK